MVSLNLLIRFYLPEVMKFTLIFVLFVIIKCTKSANILGIFHMTSYSHYQLGDRILKTLAKKGHNITVITPYLEKTPVKNFKTVVLTGLADEMEKYKVDFFKYVNIPAILGLLLVVIMGKTTAQNTLDHPNVQKLLESDEKFDLVIMEQLVNEAFYGFCFKYNASCVIISSLGSNIWMNPQLGNPNSPSYVPETVTGFPSEMNFFQRAYNAFVYILEVLVYEFYSLPTQNKLLQKYFPGAPHISELYHNTSLVLLNSNAGISNPIPLVPNMIEIGGFHVKSPKPLPKDIQEYLDSAKDGVIFFSMGSNIKGKYMDPVKREAILGAFSKFSNLKFLWKWEDENLPNKPENIKISKWLPQQDVLAHPNVKVFISHGGFLSTIEAVYHGVPIIGVPLYGDQISNIRNAENAGYGIKLEYNSLNEDALASAIRNILNDPSYTENVKKRSIILKDQPQNSLDKAIFWIEYVIRYNGAPHLRTAALSLHWFQYLLLDVIALTAFGVCASLYLFSIFIKKICKSKRSTGNVSFSKKKN